MVVFAFLYAIKNLTLNQICNKVISLQSPNKRCYILIVDFYQLVVLAAWNSTKCSRKNYYIASMSGWYAS